MSHFTQISVNVDATTKACLISTVSYQQQFCVTFHPPFWSSQCACLNSVATMTISPRSPNSGPMPAEETVHRARQACENCNKKKIRCRPFQGGSVCVSCFESNIECIPRTRQKRRRASQMHPPPQSSSCSDDHASSVPSESAQKMTAPLWNGNQLMRTERVGSNFSTTSPSNTHHPSGNSWIHREGLGDLTDSTEPDLGTEQHEVAGLTGTPSTTSYLGRSEYITHDVPIDEDSAAQYHTGAAQELSPADMKTLEALHAFDLPPRPIREALIDSFMTYCQPWTPIVERTFLWRKDGKEPSVLLLQCVFLAASRVSSAPSATSYATSEEFYRRAKALFWLGHEKDVMTMTTAVCILQWYNPGGPEHISTDTSKFWLQTTVGLAHQIGLHREPTPSRYEHMFRLYPLTSGINAIYCVRLWWSLVARDCLISAAHGRPRIINIKDCDVRSPTLADFPESRSDGLLFLAYVEICCLLGDLTKLLLRKNLSRLKRQHLEKSLYHWVKELPEELRLSHHTGSDVRSSIQYTPQPYNFRARQLHVPYFVTLAIAFRPPTNNGSFSLTSHLACSFVAGIFEDFIARDEIRFLGPIFTFYLLIAGVGLLQARNYPALWTYAQQDLQVINESFKQLSTRWASAIGASKALQSVTDAVSKKTYETPTPALMQLTPQQLSYFDVPEKGICRAWAPVHAHFNRPYSTSSNVEITSPDLMTPGFLADTRLPFGLPQMGQISGAGENLEPSDRDGMDVPEELLGEDQTSDTQYGGIGNWLLGDWSTPRPW